MFTKIILSILFFLVSLAGYSQEVISLYPGKIPDSKPVPDMEKWIANKDVDSIVNNVSIPTLTVFLPSGQKAGGASVIICPGGGYHTLLMVREGKKIAKEFNKAGIAAFVLKYRLPDDKTMIDKSIGPIQDAQRAIQLVRERASEWHIDSNKIGIMGFSAGGHLAATAGTHFEHDFADSKNGASLRPDFMVLVYPVISFTDSIGHLGSRENLLGNSPTEAQKRLFSNELQVTKKTPPTFITHAAGDQVVSSKNSLYFYEALQRNGVPAELHMYEKGEHGFLTAPPFEEWFGRCIYWMRSNGWIR